jgi:hypothetical protein
MLRGTYCLHHPEVGGSKLLSRVGVYQTVKQHNIPSKRKTTGSNMLRMNLSFKVIFWVVGMPLAVHEEHQNVSGIHYVTSTLLLIRPAH